MSASSKRICPWLRAAALASLALLICSCATVSGPDRYQPVGTTDLSALKTCEQILAPVQLPEVTAGMRADVAFLRDEAALLDARDKVESGRGCVVSVRNKFSGPPVTFKKKKAKKAKPK